MATHADADFILRLYDLRREAVCREARRFLIAWTPTGADEVRQACSIFSRQDNAWIRQATGYWEMAFSIVNSGAIDEILFAKNCGEGVLFAMKCRWLGRRFGDAWTRTMPEAEAFIARSPIAQHKAEIFTARFAD